MAATRISAPDTAKAGEVIDLKALIQHKMESGFRRGARGEVIERNIIILFECLYGEDVVFKADFFPAVAANPFLNFHTKATTSDTLTFRWTDQNGTITEETHELTVL